MALVRGKDVLDKASDEKYAVGAFNINNMEILQAVISAADNLRSPVILGVSEGAIEYADIKYILAMVKAAADSTNIPIVLHLDHGKNFEVILQCIRYGFTSLMIDASHLPLEQNIEATRRVVQVAHPLGISVEAELGRLQGVEDMVSVAEKDAILINPQEAGLFVRETGVDSLAPAIGTSHGAFKFTGKAELDFARLKETKKATQIPLVLHGASSVPADVLEKAYKYGADIPGAMGVPIASLQKAIKLGISKVNVDTDLRLAFTAAIREALAISPGQFDPRKILGPARDAMTELVSAKIKVLGSDQKA
ncbi:MAG: class II fructose-1,6-bisphosphate aldolase [Chloroflexota bacterium]|nr:class II fructose-1,6-bisphosphate aldolase [Chloroflexota bacterium]